MKLRAILKTKDYISILLLVSVFPFTNACKKESAQKGTLFYTEYAPHSVGEWRVYKVREIEHTTTGVHDTIEYYLKEVIAEEIDETNFRLERYWRDSLHQPWEIKDVWVVEKTQTMYNVVEENIKFTKLIFPIENAKQWNGNAFNNLGEQDYSFEEIHVPFSINSIDFDSTVTVLQQDEFNAIELKKAKEIYANHVGLIYRSKIDLSINTFDVTDINQGTELEYKILSYGN